MNTYKIIGMRIEKYIGQEVSGHNCDFEYTDAILDKYVICALRNDGQRVEIELTEEDGECGSGWTTASWGHMEVNKVTNFNGYTHKIIKPTTIKLNNNDDGAVENEVFTCDYDGGCGYYPSGYISVNEHLFQEEH